MNGRHDGENLLLIFTLFPTLCICVWKVSVRLAGPKGYINFYVEDDQAKSKTHDDTKIHFVSYLVLQSYYQILTIPNRKLLLKKLNDDVEY